MRQNTDKKTKPKAADAKAEAQSAPRTLRKGHSRAEGQRELLPEVSCACAVSREKFRGQDGQCLLGKGRVL